MHVDTAQNENTLVYFEVASAVLLVVLLGTALWLLGDDP